jgi:hypothetical protein
MRRLEIIRGKNHDAEYRKVSEQKTALEDQFMDGKLSADVFARMISRLEARKIELDELSKDDHPDSEEYVETGQTFAEFWAELDDEQRHVFLLDNHVTASVTRGQVSAPLPKYTAGAYDNKSKYTVWVTYPALATLLDCLRRWS